VPAAPETALVPPVVPPAVVAPAVPCGPASVCALLSEQPTEAATETATANKQIFFMRRFLPERAIQQLAKGWNQPTDEKGVRF
jgi:hypothetical protein